MTTYKEANEYLGSKTERPAPGTGTKAYSRIIRRDEHTIVMRLHRTDVVTWCDDGTCVLDSGGWKTPTTKERLQRFSGIRLFQANGIWYISDSGKNFKVFVDGMRILPDGTMEGFEEVSVEKEKAGKKLRRKVREYCEAFFAALANGDVSAPSNGDCWYCLMHTKDGEALGEVFKDKEHILEHLKEGYYVPSLLENAIKRHPVCRFTREYVTACWIAQDEKHVQLDEARRMRADEYMQGIARRDVVQSMYRYLCGQLGFAGVLLRK